MEMLKFIVLLLVAVFAQVYTVVLGSPLSSEVDGEIWSTDNWQGFPPEGALTTRLADLMKRSRAQQFHGLMGRSTADVTQLSKLGRKRNKGEMFVGLMGRRGLRGDLEEDLLPKFY
ncbi:unnamed protein product [Gadus morhua 'NCC']|uniref:Uncharacterized protein n=1 Tax=Gadus morhua TaxID=8049 RepID=A0A8C5FAW9_GADMO|nr:tachykinin-4 [Gadus chalcogrammus]